MDQVQTKHTKTTLPISTHNVSRRSSHNTSLVGILIGTTEQLPELGYAALFSEHRVVLLAERKVAENTNESFQ